MEVPINYLAVVVSALSAMVLGFLWYGPLFGKMWVASMGWTQEQMEAAKAKGMAMTYIIQALGALLMAYVLAHAIIFGNAYLGTSGITGGLMGAFWYWLGLVAPVTVGAVLWDGKSWTYFCITSGYYLVSMLIMGAILSSWI